MNSGVSVCQKCGVRDISVHLSECVRLIGVRDGVWLDADSKM